MVNVKYTIIYTFINHKIYLIERVKKQVLGIKTICYVQSYLKVTHFLTFTYF